MPYHVSGNARYMPAKCLLDKSTGGPREQHESAYSWTLLVVAPAFSRQRVTVGNTRGQQPTNPHLGHNLWFDVTRQPSGGSCSVKPS